MDLTDQSEEFTVAVAFGRFLNVEECEGSEYILKNMQLADARVDHQEEDVLADIANDVEYSTTVALWNAFVHEFQEGEMGILRSAAPTKPQHSTAPTQEGGGATLLPSGTTQHPPVDGRLEEEEMSTRGSYVPPAVGAHSEFLIPIHIISVVNTSERFDEMRRKLMLMRSGEVLNSWRQTSSGGRFTTPPRRDSSEGHDRREEDRHSSSNRSALTPCRSLRREFAGSSPLLQGNRPQSRDDKDRHHNMFSASFPLTE
jgi:hypothetical protein